MIFSNIKHHVSSQRVLKSVRVRFRAILCDNPGLDRGRGVAYTLPLPQGRPTVWKDMKHPIPFRITGTFMAGAFISSLIWLIAGIPYVCHLRAERDVIPLVLSSLAQLPAQKVVEELSNPGTNGIVMAQRSGLRVVQGFIATYDRFEKVHPGIANGYRDDYLAAKAFVAKYSHLAEYPTSPNRGAVADPQ